MSITQWMCVLAAFTCSARSAPTSTAHTLFLVSCTGIQVLAVFSSGSAVLCRSFLRKSWLPTAVVPYSMPIARTSDVVKKCKRCKRRCIPSSMEPKMCDTCCNRELSEKLRKLAEVRAKELARQREVELERACHRLKGMRIQRRKDRKE